MAVEDGWGDDDDLDGLDSPKRTSSGFGSLLSLEHGTTLSFTSPATSSLSSSTSSVKLGVSREPGMNTTSFAVQTTPASSIVVTVGEETTGGVLTMAWTSTYLR